MTARDRAQAVVDELGSAGSMDTRQLVARIEGAIEAALREQEVALHEKWTHGAGKRDCEKGWRVRRAEYLIESGRADQVKAEGLEHEIPRRSLGAAPLPSLDQEASGC